MAPTHQIAEVRRDIGMTLAENKANRDEPGWTEDAMRTIETYCKAHPDRKFLAEDVRDWGEKLGLVSQPENLRCWGSVLRKASKLQIIRKVGFAPAKSSNLSAKVLWTSIS